MNSKVDRLSAELRAFERVAVALSGGLDSSVLLALCVREIGAENCLALTAVSPYMVSTETESARGLCARLGVRLDESDFGILPEIKNNPQERCYLCKRAVFSKLIDAAKKFGFSVVADGTNADDLSDYRPGMRALAELGVKSPLLDFGLGKDDIRAIAPQLGIMPSPASACLMTRFETGVEINEESLRRVDSAEGFLHSVGFEAVRVRVHGSVARIEIAKSDFGRFCQKNIFSSVSQKFGELGFKHTALDISGYSRGSMNLTK